MPRRPAKLERPRKRAPAVAFGVVHRNHAADVVFVKLAEAILEGQLTPGQALPPERVLAAQFSVSRVIARQAVHRLAEIGLARVRQGGPTVVLDPQEASDLRVLELTYQVGPTTATDVYHFTERQIMQGHALLHLAERHGTDEDFAAIEAILEDYAARGGTAEEMPAFEDRFWGRIALAGKNRLFQHEHRWWRRVMQLNPRALHPIVAPADARLAALREIVRRLKARAGAAAFFLDASQVILTAIEHMPPAPRRRRDDR